MPSYKSAAPAVILPDGPYGFRVVKATLGRSPKDPNIETVELELDVEGTRVWETLTFSEKAAFKIDAFRASIGETVTPGEHVDIDESDWVGATGRLVVFTDTYNGKEKNKVKEFLPTPIKPGSPAVNEHGEPDDLTF